MSNFLQVFIAVTDHSGAFTLGLRRLEEKNLSFGDDIGDDSSFVFLIEAERMWSDFPRRFLSS